MCLHPQRYPKRAIEAVIKRILDAVLGGLILGVLSVPMILIAMMIKVSTKGGIIYWSSRVGQHNHLFKMPKFRTMRPDTPALPTHLLKNPDLYVTGIGAVLRRTSLDELPQIISVIQGKMSLVGPRPALFNQEDLIALRTSRGIHRIKPGITGWAQINGRDELPIPVKVALDEYYAQNRSVEFDVKIMLLTVLKVFKREGIDH